MSRRARLDPFRRGYSGTSFGQLVVGGKMTITGIISALLVGIVVGALGRLVVPGRQHIPIWLTIVIGIVAAFIGTGIARALGVPTVTNGIDWLELIVQVV